MRRWVIALACWAAAGATAAGQHARADGPLRLRDAIDEALRASPALSHAEDAVESARIQRRLAESRFGVKVTPNMNVGTAPAGFGQRTFGVDVRKRLPIGSELSASVNSYNYGNGAGALHDTGYTVGISQPLFLGMATATLDLKAAERATVASDRGLSEAKQQLVVTVADRFFAVVQAHRFVLAGERAVDRATALSKASQARASIGLATQLDVLRADLLASQAAVALASQREALVRAMEDLNLLLGRSPTQPIAVADDDLSDESLVAAGIRVPEASDEAAVDRLVREALAVRPDVREARDKVADAERLLAVSRQDLLPHVTLNVSYTQRGLGPSATPGLADVLNGWRVGAISTYSLDRADQVATVGNAAVSLRAAQRAAVDTDRRVEAEVRRAFRTWKQSRETIEIQRKAVDLTARQQRLAELRYERGLASSLELIDAESDLYQTQTALIAAEVGRALATLALQRARGALDTERVQP